MLQRTDLVAINRQLARESYTLKRAFFVFAKSMKSPAMMEKIAECVKHLDINAVTRLMQPELERLGGEVSVSFLRSANEEAKRMRAHARERFGKSRIMKAPRVGVDFSFDPGDEVASEVMFRSKLRLITDLSADQRDTVRAAIADSLQRGVSPQAAARSFRDAIGLSSTQYAAVANYRRLLEQGSTEALGRGLRDARYDRKVSAALERGDVLAGSQIDTMVERYADNMLAFRADNIARTESHRALSQGRYQAFNQLANRYDIDESGITRTWNATKDKRTRDTHADMDGQQVSGFEPFISPSGARLRFPGDPNAPAAETINCLLPGSVIDAPDLVATARGSYNGKAVIIVTALGRELSVTANHPILTRRGWKPACLLNETDYLIAYRRPEDSFSMYTGIDTDDVPSLIEDVHESGLVFHSREVMGGVNFHGDIINGKVDIKLQAGSLISWFNLLLAKQIGQTRLAWREICSELLSRNSTLRSNLLGIFLSFPRSVGRSDLGLLLLLSHLRPFNEFLLALRAYPYTVFKQDSVDCLPILQAKILGDCIDRASALIELDQVINIRTFPARTHVYSPQTVSGLYLAEGIVNHNCRCVETYDIG